MVSPLCLKRSFFYSSGGGGVSEFLEEKHCACTVCVCVCVLWGEQITRGRGGAMSSIGEPQRRRGSDGRIETDVDKHTGGAGQRYLAALVDEYPLHAAGFLVGVPELLALGLHLWPRTHT